MSPGLWVNNTYFVALISEMSQLFRKLTSDGNKPRWFVSPLFDVTHTITLNSGTTMIGFRIRPGTCFNEEHLLASMSENSFELNDISERLDTFFTRNYSVEEALYSLASSVKTVTQTAIEIGTTPRTLQRLVMRETGKSPVYWLLLARVRKAARALNSSLDLAEIAELHGYVDQAHMSREFKRWFNTSPSVLRHHPSIANQLYNEGYDGTDTGVHNSIKKPFLSET